MEESKTKRTRIIYSKDPAYKLVPATGAWGGVSPQREIIVDFYVDNLRSPDSVEITTVGEDIKKEDRTPAESPIDRVLQFGIVMRPDIARSIGKFLVKKADEAFVGEQKEEGDN